ncbi:hypothetical protein DFP73DRAFT_339202 [Morchella snyderi]|nr:hypothetical protein DFP73DRAFT_339202 [Morchella snyderi]
MHRLSKLPVKFLAQAAYVLHILTNCRSRKICGTIRNSYLHWRFRIVIPKQSITPFGASPDLVPYLPSFFCPGGCQRRRLKYFAHEKIRNYR